ncbi:coiled-coil domain-containing protein 178 isoform X2 [Electrophorus electricus]|uniref:coiled-coil domain-containing protein 178 isoform X2 n=1 Tax=Electrophorus electricus TaxID=8005 RepID=UPI0015CF91B1|nr:coiled-coil domain-containing protein 178 isoform X2 [Electrophorus electricus]
MPDIELLQSPSREVGDSLQDQRELQRVYVSHSFELENTPVPCVKKAKSHIQELKNKLGSWCQQGIDNQEDHSGGGNQNGVIWRFDSTNYTVPVTSTELCIEGRGLCLLRNYENETLDLFWKGIAGMDGVLLEVLSLVERLESGRQEAREVLRDEWQRAQRLRMKQDSLSLWKQQQFPAAVQLEYEVCTGDIAELKWHLKLCQEKRQRARSSLNHVEVQNRQLDDDIDFLQKHGPLMKEKLQLESEVMKQIKSAQAQVNDTFSNLSHDLRKSQEELENEELKANKEREVMSVELKDVQNHLKDRLTEFQHLKSYWDFCCFEVRKTEENIALKDTQLNTMIQQIQLLETQEIKINTTVVELRAKLDDQEKKLREKHDEITSLQKQIQATRGKREAKVLEYEDICRGKRQELQHLHGQNKDHGMDIEAYNKKISQSKQAVKQLQGEHKQILEKISQNEEQRDQAERELTLQAALCATTRASLEDLEHQSFMQEQRMRKETEKLKMELMNEMKVVLVLEGNIASITEEFNLAKADCERVENELVKEYEDTCSTAGRLEIEMVELREIHTAKYKTTENLKWKLNDILNKHKRLSDELKQQKSVCLDHLDSANKAHSAVSVRYDQVTSRIEELIRKSEEYRKVSVTMEHIVATMPRVIEELQNVCDVVEYKHSAAGLVMGSLQREMVACRTRTVHAKESHSTFLSQRDTTMQDLQANLKKALKKNALLAQEYRELQKALMMAKREALYVFTEKNRAEASFHDHKQLSLLQRKMHKAMLKYFKHRSVYSQAELAHFQALSNQNNQKMKALQCPLVHSI